MPCRLHRSDLWRARRARERGRVRCRVRGLAPAPLGREPVPRRVLRRHAAAAPRVPVPCGPTFAGEPAGALPHALGRGARLLCGRHLRLRPQRRVQGLCALHLPRGPLAAQSSGLKLPRGPGRWDLECLYLRFSRGWHSHAAHARRVRLLRGLAAVHQLHRSPRLARVGCIRVQTRRRPHPLGAGAPLWCQRQCRAWRCCVWRERSQHYRARAWRGRMRTGETGGGSGGRGCRQRAGSGASRGCRAEAAGSGRATAPAASPTRPRSSPEAGRSSALPLRLG
mmetsp:Transcript_6444/g.18688  ORF Transcript_6444/g.18688 Transcript_6444/m.18688 type:complete len:281 (+) Transcript_6444:375-1217(+)